MSSLDCLDLCRLCLVKDSVSVPIFGGEGDARQIFLKIAACLPVKVARDDKLPKKICDQCLCKVELCYEFWNTTVNSEKQLLEWLGGSGVGDKQNYVSDVLNPNIMKQEQSNENRLDGTVMQVSGHQSSMAIGMMGNLALNMPIIISTSSQQQISSVPMDTSCNSVQAAQPLPGPSSQTSHSQNQVNSVGQEEEESTEEDDNTDDDGDAEEGLPVKEESEEDVNTNRSIEPTTFVNVSLACDEAGPSGLQQQKISEMPEMTISQTTDGDPKSGFFISKIELLPEQDQEESNELKEMYDTDDPNLLIEEQLKSGGMQMIMQCTTCGKTFISEKKLRAHIKTHDVLSDDNISLVYQDSEVEMQQEEEVKDERVIEEEVVEMQQINDDSFVCEHCGIAFSNCDKLMEHQTEHFPDNNIEITEYVNADVDHSESSVEFKFQCDNCGIGLATQEELQVHQSTHTKEKPFQCEICNATFRYRQGLRLHSKLHQPDYVPPQKKHHCELCNKRFSRKQVLLVHMKTHGNVGPQNEFTCPICCKTVSSKTYLTVHLRKHTGEKPHVCDLCGKGFISQNYLSVHRRTHTGERPHKCTHCDKRFTQRTTLVVHLRGHTGDRPYPCTFCHKSFASKTMLNSHLKTHAKQTARQQQEQRQQQLQQQQIQEEQSLGNVILLPS